MLSGRVIDQATVYRFQFHHSEQHFHIHLELQGGTKQEDTNPVESLYKRSDLKRSVRSVVHPAPHVTFPVSQLVIILHTNVCPNKDIYPTLPSIAITSFCGISDRRRWMRCCDRQETTPTAQQTGLTMKSDEYTFTDRQESDGFY